MAFVVAAKRFGYFFKRRTASGVDVVEPVFPSAGAGEGGHREQALDRR